MKNEIEINLEDKIEESYLNYSLSVIIDRALPDVRDGLKPVHRRILYATKKLGLTHDKPHKKSARIVGDVLGKYHPHGDQSVYNAMVRMAQDFNQRYPLINGHGNFGSIDGDGAAAMRYTEAKLENISEDILKDIEEETVDFKENFDGSLLEPTVLPSKIPNLIVNGSNGIAVGMKTDIPPHNLKEVVDALIALLKGDSEEVDVSDYIKGPDFPTGGEILGDEGIKEYFGSGNGKITLRGKIKFEKEGKQERIILYEIPYQLRKEKLIENIAKAIKEDKIEEVKDLRDESDRDGIRIVLDLKKKTNSEIVLNKLYKYTDFQKDIRINVLALENNRPKLMNVKDALIKFLNFRKEVVTKRTQYRLSKAKKDEQMLLGYEIAINNLNKVIEIIKKSFTNKKARENLISDLGVNQEQANAILKIQLQRLIGFEIKKLKEDIKKIKKNIKYLDGILNKKEKLNQVIKKELAEISEKYGDKRKTAIIRNESKTIIDEKDIIEKKKAIISFSYNGKIKRSDKLESVKFGKDDFVVKILKGTSYDKILFFNEKGKSYLLDVCDIPDHHGLSIGDDLKDFIKLPLEDEIVGIELLNEDSLNDFITFSTQKGLIKKTKLEEYKSNYSSLTAINLSENDKVVSVVTTKGKEDIFLTTLKGQSIKFNSKEINDTGRNTKGSKGIKLEKNDKVVSSNIIKQSDDKVLFIDEENNFKKVSLSKFKRQKRAGKGIKSSYQGHIKLKSALTVNENDKILIDYGKEGEETKEISSFKTSERKDNLENKLKYDFCKIYNLNLDKTNKNYEKEQINSLF